MICKYCTAVEQSHPEGRYSWTGYECMNSKSNRFNNTRSTISALCEECKDYKYSKEDFDRLKFEVEKLCQSI